METGDQWIGTDDAGGTRHPGDHPLHPRPVGLAAHAAAVIGDNIEWTYNLTVPAGQTVSLAYFTIVNASRAGAVAAANALVTPTGFGGQAALGLSQTLLNFGFDQPPVVSVGNAGPVTFIRGGAAIAVAPNLTLTDPDNTTLASATVAIGGGELEAAPKSWPPQPPARASPPATMARGR